ncbi:MAG TPA: helix-turn-helix domain-containing protein [Xanthobacteraceae bacterium]|nr:helix-turn-helix domain-containing protein [Xanthobacteraceae bacterium]
MAVVETTSLAQEPDARGRILLAAERAFTQRGFHATTMQDVAAEAGMSPGNLYRYFRSKDAIVAGLCARDQADLAADFRALVASGDILAAMRAILRKHLIEEPAECFQLMVEIWAESARNAEIAAICREFDHEVRRGLKTVIAGAKQQGVAARDLDEDFAARAILTIGSGLFKRRATEAAFDGESELILGLAMVRAVLRGDVYPDPAADAEAVR